jgi:hypothetical protein
MARASYSFKQRDMTRAVRAVVAAGLAVASVEVDKTGKIIVRPKTTEPMSNDSSWDSAVAELEAR